MTKLDRLLRLYKDAKEAQERTKAIDGEEASALEEIKQGAAEDVCTELLRALEAGESVHITDIPTLREVLRGGAVSENGDI